MGGMRLDAAGRRGSACPAPRAAASSLGDAVDVGAVGQVADPEAQDRNGPCSSRIGRIVWPRTSNGTPGCDPARTGSWARSPAGQSAMPSLERVGEDPPDAVLGLAARRRPAPGPPIHLGNSRASSSPNRWSAWWCVKAIAWTRRTRSRRSWIRISGVVSISRLPARERQQDAGPGPLVPRVARGADRTVAAQHRDARRCPGPQEDQPPRWNERAFDQPIPSPGSQLTLCGRQREILQKPAPDGDLKARRPGVVQWPPSLAQPP